MRGQWLVIISTVLFVASSCQKAQVRDPGEDAEEEPRPVINLPDLFEEVAQPGGIEHTYQNGQEFTLANGKKGSHFAILESLGGGVALIDYDGDGLLDIFVTGGGYFAGKDHKEIKGYPNRLYKNLGNWKFKDVTREVGLDQPLFYSHGCAVADYDRDGWPDLLVTGWGRVALYHNEPLDPANPAKGRRFREVTREVGLLDRGHIWASSAAFADLDGDGYPDLYICQYVNWSWKNNPLCGGYRSDVKQDVCPPLQFDSVPHVLYHNTPGKDGQRFFRDVSKSAGLRTIREEKDYDDLKHLDARGLNILRRAQRENDFGKGLGVLIVDVNGDCKPDIYVANDTSGNFLYMNQSKPGQILLEEVGFGLGVSRDSNGKATGSMGVDAADYDGSGLPSLWVTNYEGELHSLYTNASKAGMVRFQHSTEQAGIAALGKLYVGFGTAFADLDNHGFPDLVITNGHVVRYPPQAKYRQHPVLFRNQGKGRFVDMTRCGGPYFRTDHLGRGLAVGDLHNNGLPDLVISHINDPVAVLRNVARQGHHWLGVELAAHGHADIVGAKLTLEVDGRKLTQFAKGGGSYLSSSDRRFLFGVGKSTQLGKVTVAWPSGQPATEVWEGLSADRYYRLTQGQGRR
jgi:hypothetical protein